LNSEFIADCSSFEDVFVDPDPFNQNKCGFSPKFACIITGTGRVADPDPGSGAFFTPSNGSGIRVTGWKKTGSGIWDEHIPDIFSESSDSFQG
jgi:hypothetical protein